MMNSEISFPIKDDSIPEILERYQTTQTLSKDDALALLESNDILPLLKLSASLKTRFKKDVITYSRKIFINITNLCRDFCSYCTYRKNPFESSSIMMKPAAVSSRKNLAAAIKRSLSRWRTDRIAAGL